MAVEIELKAWVDDEISLKQRLDTIATFLGAFHKEDNYWQPGGNLCETFK